MWFMNKIANPFVRLILRSPLHRWMSAALLLITYRGRRSGKEYTLPVQYVQAGQTIIIIPGAPQQKTWWRNLRGGASVQLTLAGKTLTGQATVLEGSAQVEYFAAALAAYLRRFPPAARLHNLSPAADGSFNQVELRRAALESVAVRVELDQ